jgi:ubiquinone/menaquinone biosynthesis C-methylase UbiE
VGPDGASPRFFDRWSRTYDNAAIQAAFYRPVQDAVVEALRSRPGARILDVGCGTGLLTRRLASEMDATVVGCDYSRGMLEEAIRRGGGAWVQGDAQALPIADEAVDAVVSTESFHWYPDQRLAFAEFRRVLRPGGRAYVALINTRTLTFSLLTRRWSELAGQPLRWPTVGGMRAMARAAGFEVVRQQRIRRPLMRAPLPTVLTVCERPL